MHYRKSSGTRHSSRKVWESSSVGATCVASAFALVCPAIGAAIEFETACLSAESEVAITGSCAMLTGTDEE